MRGRQWKRYVIRMVAMKKFQKKNFHFEDEDVKNDSLLKKTKNPLAIGFKRQFLG